MKFLLILIFVTITNICVNAQAYLRTEYIGISNYKDADNEKTGGKGDAKVFSGAVQIPLSVKMNENNRPTMWGVGIGGSYTSFGNKNISEDLSPSEIMNAQISFMHLRPISKNWSLLASLGAGSYTSHTDINRITMKNILAHGGAAFVWHLRGNLDVGMGLAINNSFGYPMAFPLIYANWSLSGRYEVKVSMADAFEISAGMKLHNDFKLSLVAEANGALALEEVNGKDMMFSHQYMTVGLRPELILSKSFSIPITAGISAYRPAFHEERSLKSFFKAMNREYDPAFSIAPYVSATFRYNF